MICNHHGDIVSNYPSIGNGRNSHLKIKFSEQEKNTSKTNAFLEEIKITFNYQWTSYCEQLASQTKGMNSENQGNIINLQ